MRDGWLLPTTATALLLLFGMIDLTRPATGGGEAVVRPRTLGLELKNAELQQGLERRLASSGLESLVAERRLGVSVVDLSDPDFVRYAGVNDDEMIYAASLPKIAVLLAAFDQIQLGRLADTPELKHDLTDMIRHSSNEAATRVIRSIGFEAIAACLEQPRYELYDREGAGGLWVGKAYDGQPAVARDPVAGTSHGATARQAARFFALLDRGLLVSPARSREMLEILGDPGVNHKFVKGLANRPGTTLYRKSGTWRTFHADAALIEGGGRKYAAAALIDDPQGNEMLEHLIVALDDLIQVGAKGPLE